MKKASTQEELDQQTRLAEYERRMISGEQHSPMAQRIIDQMKVFAPPEERPVVRRPMAVAKKDIVVLAAELSIVEGVEVVPDASTFEVSKEKPPVQPDESEE